MSKALLDSRGITDLAIESAAADLVCQLGAGAKTVAVAESCTGGAIAQALTAVAGASKVFGFGFVVYSNRAKESLLGVSAASLQSYGAVSLAVAEEMARGALSRAGSDFALAVTGVAGPTGGSAEKPVGTVWFALAQQRIELTPVVKVQVQVRSLRKRFAGGRDEIQAQATLFALAWLVEETKELSV